MRPRCSGQIEPPRRPRSVRWDAALGVTYSTRTTSLRARPVSTALTLPASRSGVRTLPVSPCLDLGGLSNESVRRCRGIEDKLDLVDEAPAPILPRFRRANDRMPGRARMGCRVLVWRAVTTADMAAGLAHAQVHPVPAGRETLLAARYRGRNLGHQNAVRVRADLIHGTVTSQRLVVEELSGAELSAPIRRRQYSHSVTASRGARAETSVASQRRGLRSVGRQGRRAGAHRRRARSVHAAGGSNRRLRRTGSGSRRRLLSGRGSRNTVIIGPTSGALGRQTAPSADLVRPPLPQPCGAQPRCRQVNVLK